MRPQNAYLFIISIALLIAFVISFALADCEDDLSIRSKSDDGQILVLDDGTTWEVNAADRVDSALWLVTDDVIVCDDEKIIHKDDGETVEAHQVR